MQVAVGSVLLAVDGSAVRGMSAEELTSRIRGQPGSRVTLTVAEDRYGCVLCLYVARVCGHMFMLRAHVSHSRWLKIGMFVSVTCVYVALMCGHMFLVMMQCVTLDG